MIRTTRFRLAALPALATTTLLLVLTGLALPAGLLAQDACDGPPTTASMRRCQEARLALAEERLAAVLAELEHEVGEVRAELLGASQRAWEEHRTAHCRFVSARFEGGSLQPVLLTGCFEETTRGRVEALRRQLEVEREGGGP